MKTSTVRALSLLVLIAVANAGSASDMREPPREFQADLDGDGWLETVRVKFSGRNDQGEFFHLEVANGEGRVIWTGPKDLDPDNRLVFGNLEFGQTMPTVIADIDGDGAVELVAGAPQSDVSPRWFRVLRWSHGAFKPVRSGSLFEDPPGSKLFPWGETQEYKGRWINELWPSPDGAAGEFEAELIEYPGETSIRSGRGVVEATPQGFRLVRMITPMRKPEAEPPEETPNSGTSGSGSVLAAYMCQIGDEDLRNSKGERLKTVRDILAQDRANFHKHRIRHRRDIAEETYFASAANRQMFQSARLEVPDRLAKWIIEGGAIVQVTVYPGRIVVSQP
ncbi:MAG: VCBS repeat-containing protein [Candidatus Sumerlaeaceae bacterium]|nr:VCBS repeat-containing protein [Candidatus Sumerlaeaceae bacterium]